MSNARRDGNFVPAMQGVSSVDGSTPTDVWVNPSTHAVLIDSTSLFSGLDSRYLQLAGVSGGQTAYGGTGSGDDLILESTSHATKGYLLLQPNGGFTGIGTSTPAYALHIVDTASNTFPFFVEYNNTANNRGLNLVSNDLTANSLCVYRFSLVNDAGTSRAAGGFIIGKEQLWTSTLSTNDSYFSIYTSLNGVYGEKVRISSAGYVGIGTTGFTTAGKLMVQGSASAITSIFRANATSPGNILEAQNSSATILASIGSTGVISSAVGIRPITDSATGLQIQTVGGTAIMNIDTTNRRVGIGNLTTAPETDIHIINATAGKILTETRNASNPSYLLFRRSGASLADLATGDRVGSFQAEARYNGAYNGVAQIDFLYQGSGTSQAGSIQFKVSETGQNPATALEITELGAIEVLSFGNTPTAITDGFSIWSSDYGAGDAGMYIISETGATHKFASVAELPALIVNEAGTSTGNVRFESDTEANMLFLDADGNTDGTLYIGGNSATTSNSSRKGGLFFPVQAPTASAPTYVKGAIYFDTTLNKLRVGGATAWETITSV